MEYGLSDHLLTQSHIRNLDLEMLICNTSNNVLQLFVKAPLVIAGKYGRSGLNCTKLVSDCENENWNFMNMADTFLWSQYASINSLEKLISWAYHK